MSCTCTVARGRRGNEYMAIAAKLQEVQQAVVSAYQNIVTVVAEIKTVLTARHSAAPDDNPSYRLS